MIKATSCGTSAWVMKGLQHSLGLAPSFSWSNMPEWLAQQFCHRASVKHARMACTKFRQNILKHAEKYVKHGLHQISVKHARKAAACTNSHNCTCFFPCWIKASRCQKTCGFHAGSRLHTPSVKASSVTKRHEGRCLQVPRLPRNTTFDVATPATQNEGWCEQAPRLPHKTKVDVAKRRAGHAKRKLMHVSKCHACHAKRKLMWASATPAMHSAAAPRATNGAQARHQIQPGVIRATPATQNEGRGRQAPRLPRKTKVDVSKCHACHAQCRGATGG